MAGLSKFFLLLALLALAAAVSLALIGAAETASSEATYGLAALAMCAAVAFGLLAIFGPHSRLLLALAACCAVGGGIWAAGKIGPLGWGLSLGAVGALALLSVASVRLPHLGCTAIGGVAVIALLLGALCTSTLLVIAPSEEAESATVILILLSLGGGFLLVLRGLFSSPDQEQSEN